MAQNITENNKREFRSLEDILDYKEELRTRIHQDEEKIASAWNELFHKEEPAPQNKAQKIAPIKINFPLRIECLLRLPSALFYKKSVQILPNLLYWGSKGMPHLVCGMVSQHGK